MLAAAFTAAAWNSSAQYISPEKLAKYQAILDADADKFSATEGQKKQYALHKQWLANDNIATGEYVLSLFLSLSLLASS